MCSVLITGCKHDETAGLACPLSAEKPAPTLVPRIRSLLKDLAADDLGMALLDLVQLSRLRSQITDGNRNDREGYCASTWKRTLHA
jgi:hypothetical protein